MRRASRASWLMAAVLRNWLLRLPCEAQRWAMDPCRPVKRDSQASIAQPWLLRTFALVPGSGRVSETPKSAQPRETRKAAQPTTCRRSPVLAKLNGLFRLSTVRTLHYPIFKPFSFRLD